MAFISTSPTLNLLRKAAPNLTRHFFSCCSRSIHGSSTIRTAAKPLRFSHPKSSFKSTRNTPFLQAFRSRSTPAITTETSFNVGLGSASKVGQGTPQLVAHSSFPQTSKRVVGWWLLGSAASVFGIVVFGALTRLTESGLSITEWRPVTGTMPPLSMEDWHREFQKYKASPEFERLNPNMDLAAFKEIFWMEYIHRLWGRVIGLSFLIPTIYFIARRQVSKPLARNLVLINGLIGLQGFIGWWMVKSGLKDDLFAQGAYPRVSQYRLAAHLGLAFTVYVSMLWNGTQVFLERQYLNLMSIDAAKTIQRLSSPKLRALRTSVAALSVLIFTTAISGAFVAGLDAGLIYNEFPYMGLGLTPPKAELWDAFYSRLPSPHPDLWWRNMFENPSLVQLDHRILATTTFTAVHILFFYSRFSPSVRSLLTQGGKRALSAALGLVWLQVFMGISTLIYLVPTSLAAAHQAGSLALLTSVVVLGSRVSITPRLARLVKSMPQKGVYHVPLKKSPIDITPK